jgi:hypothetical protein
MRFATLILALSACTPPADDLAALLPDDRLAIDDGGLAAAARGIGSPSDYYALTVTTTAEINAPIHDVVGLIDQITALDPSWTDHDQTALWGLWLDDGTWLQLWVQRDDDGGHSWAIEIRPEESAEDAWVAVLAGHIEAGSDATNSTGSFVLDLTAIDENGAGDGETGQMAAEYEILEDGAVATVAFGDFSEDGSIPADVGYHYETTRGAGGLMDVAVETDASDPANGTLELAVIRSRWDGTGAGRADALLTGGDLGELVFTESECWSAAHLAVYYGSDFDQVIDGDESACVFGEASFAD